MNSAAYKFIKRVVQTNRIAVSSALMTTALLLKMALIVAIYPHNIFQCSSDGYLSGRAATAVSSAHMVQPAYLLPVKASADPIAIDTVKGNENDPEKITENYAESGHYVY